MEILVKSYKGNLLGKRIIQALFSKRKKEVSNLIAIAVPISVKGIARRIELSDKSIGKPFFTGKLKTPRHCQRGDTIVFTKGTIVLTTDMSL